uniref:Uncharacterized protein n=1 Tax=Anopheles albimanus TaxID=7167 RepID=A0A182FXF4_ANOAL
MHFLAEIIKRSAGGKVHQQHPATVEYNGCSIHVHRLQHECSKMIDARVEQAMLQPDDTAAETLVAFVDRLTFHTKPYKIGHRLNQTYNHPTQQPNLNASYKANGKAAPPNKQIVTKAGTPELHHDARIEHRGNSCYQDRCQCCPRAVADVKADVTGSEMRQIRKPSRAPPISSSTIPAVNESTTTYCGGWFDAYCTDGA